MIVSGLLRWKEELSAEPLPGFMGALVDFWGPWVGSGPHSPGAGGNCVVRGGGPPLHIPSLNLILISEALYFANNDSSHK